MRALLWIRYVLLAAGLLAASWTDWRMRKIPNRLTVSMAAAGLILAAAEDGLSGVGWSLTGLLAGLAVGMLLWLLHTLRAGDAKLLAALGAMMGWLWLADCFSWALVIGAAVGGVLLWAKGELVSRMKRLWLYLKVLMLTRRFEPYQPEDTRGELPFAPCLAVGALLACLVPVWQTI